MKIKQKKNSLRLTVLVAAGLCFFAFMTLFYVVFQFSIAGMLKRADEHREFEHINSASGILETAFSALNAMTIDNANWKETVDFMRGSNPDFVVNNWPDTFILEALRYNLLIMLDTDGNLVYGEYYDYTRGYLGNVPPEAVNALKPVAGAILEQYANDPEDIFLSGTFTAGGDTYYVCGVPVALFGERGEPAGTFFFGNKLDNSYFENLLHFSGVTLRIEDTHGAFDSDSEFLYMRYSPPDAAGIYFKTLTGGSQRLVLEADRTIYQDGEAAMRSILSTLTIMVLLLMALIYFFINAYMLTPMERLTSDVGKIATINTGKLPHYSTSREFEVLRASINEMLKRLQESDESQQVLQSIFNGMDSYVFVTDSDTDEILFMNEKMKEHYDISGDAAGQVCWKVLQDNGTRRCEFCPMHTLSKDPEHVVLWERQSTVTGRYYQCQDKLIPWIGGKLVHMQHAIDITGIKKAEEAVWQRLEQQELMASISRSFVSIGDSQNLINKALEMTGVFLGVSRLLIGKIDHGGGTIAFTGEWTNPEQQAPRRIGVVFPFTIGDPFYEAFMINNAGYVASDNTVNDPDYSYLAEFIQAFIDVPIYISGELWGLLCVDNVLRPHTWTSSDVQLLSLIGSIIAGAIARSDTEHTLSMMSSIAASSPQFVSYINADGYFEYFNEGVLNITGYSPDEIMKQGLAAFFPPEILDKLNSTYFPQILNAGKIVLNLPIIRKDGEERILNFNLFTTSASKSGIGIIASDITDRLRLEKELVVAKEQAEQSSRAKGDFLAKMSHEMRTPMNAIMGMASIARASGDIERMQYCLERIDEASQYLLGVINDILDMSKIESGKMELSFYTFEFEHLLTAAINVIKNRAEEKNQALTVRLDPDAPRFIESDDQHLEQVIVNLLSNAVKFTPEYGTITLTAILEDETAGICTLRVSVTDTGIGISEENQKKLFRSFEQADGGISRKFGGTGLGLAISKSLVEMMGGTIWIESEEGKGASFIFNIKCKRMDDPGTKGNGTGLEDGEIPDYTGKRILLADDVDINREIVLALLDDTGVIIDCAEDGRDAVQKFKDYPDYDMIFMDIHMPEVDGYEATRQIRALGSRQAMKAPIVAMTANVFREDVERCLEAGMNDHIGKPVELDAILSKMNQYLFPQQ